jgi:hypothetical protein
LQLNTRIFVIEDWFFRRVDVTNSKSGKEEEILDAFRSDLESVLVVVKALSSVCCTPAEVAGVVQLALSNNGQLKLLVEKVDQLRQ